MRELHHASTPDELAFLCAEVWGDECRCAASASKASAASYGLCRLQPGDLFVDVGANVGLASLYAAERVRARKPGRDRPGAVIALEPLPPTHTALRANFACYLSAWGGGKGEGPAASAAAAAGLEVSLLQLAAVEGGVDGSDLRLQQQEQEEVEMTAWPRAAGWATLTRGGGGGGGSSSRMQATRSKKEEQEATNAADASLVIDDMLVFLRSHVRDVASGKVGAPGFGSRALSAAAAFLAASSPRVFDAVARLYVERVMLSGARRVSVPASSLSRALRPVLDRLDDGENDDGDDGRDGDGDGGSNGRRRRREVALLKVDVEGAEVGVLRGVARRDWPRIRRVVVEASSAAGGEEGQQEGNNVEVVARLLREVAGFESVRVSQAPALEGTSLYLVEAERGGCGGDGGGEARR
jgi:hypothetical protein